MATVLLRILVATLETVVKLAGTETEILQNHRRNNSVLLRAPSGALFYSASLINYKYNLNTF